MVTLEFLHSETGVSLCKNEMILAFNRRICLILAALITGCIHGVNLMFISYMPRFFRSTGRVSTVSGICNACAYVGSTLSSYGVAWIAARFGWQNALFFWGALAVVSVILCASVAKKWAKFAQKNN